MAQNISEQTLSIHRDQLYAGYIDKKKEIFEKLIAYQAVGVFSSANQTYSDLRALKDGETFAANGVYLHEWYFDVLGGNSEPRGPVADALAIQYGSIEIFLKYFAACGMAARGWAVLAWDIKEKALRVYSGDTHNQGGVWGALPVLVLDVYEHAYFLDFGADRKSYIETFIKQINWDVVNKNFISAAAFVI